MPSSQFQQIHSQFCRRRPFLGASAGWSDEAYRLKFGIGGTYWTEMEKKQNAVKDKEAVQPSEEAKSAKSSDLATTPIASTVTFGESSRVCENKEHSQLVSAKIFDRKQKGTKDQEASSGSELCKENTALALPWAPLHSKYSGFEYHKLVELYERMEASGDGIGSILEEIQQGAVDSATTGKPNDISSADGGKLDIERKNAEICEGHEDMRNKSADKEGAEVEAETEPLQVDNEDMPCDAVPTIFGHHNERTSDGIECEDGIVPAQPEQKIDKLQSSQTSVEPKSISGGSGTEVNGFFCLRQLVDYSSSSEEEGEEETNSSPTNVNKSAGTERAEVEAETELPQEDETEPSQVINEDMLYEGVFIDFDHHNGDTSDDIEYEDGIEVLPTLPKRKKKRRSCISRNRSRKRRQTEGRLNFVVKREPDIDDDGTFPSIQTETHLLSLSAENTKSVGEEFDDYCDINKVSERQGGQSPKRGRGRPPKRKSSLGSSTASPISSVSTPTRLPSTTNASLQSPADEHLFEMSVSLLSKPSKQSEPPAAEITPSEKRGRGRPRKHHIHENVSRTNTESTDTDASNDLPTPKTLTSVLLPSPLTLNKTKKLQLHQTLSNTPPPVLSPAFTPQKVPPAESTMEWSKIATPNESFEFVSSLSSSSVSHHTKKLDTEGCSTKNVDVVASAKSPSLAQNSFGIATESAHNQSNFGCKEWTTSPALVTVPALQNSTRPAFKGYLILPIFRRQNGIMSAPSKSSKDSIDRKTQQRREKALVKKSAPPNRRHSELNRQLPNSVEMNTSVDTPVKRGRGRPRKSECVTPLSLKPLTVVSSKKTKTTTKKAQKRTSTPAISKTKRPTRPPPQYYTEAGEPLFDYGDYGDYDEFFDGGDAAFVMDQSAADDFYFYDSAADDDYDYDYEPQDEDDDVDYRPGKSAARMATVAIGKHKRTASHSPVKAKRGKSSTGGTPSSKKAKIAQAKVANKVDRAKNGSGSSFTTPSKSNHAKKTTPSSSGKRSATKGSKGRQSNTPSVQTTVNGRKCAAITPVVVRPDGSVSLDKSNFSGPMSHTVQIGALKYTYAHTLKNLSTSWTCSKYKTTFCKGRIYVSADMTNATITQPHTFSTCVQAKAAEGEAKATCALVEQQQPEGIATEEQMNLLFGDYERVQGLEDEFPVEAL